MPLNYFNIVKLTRGEVFEWLGNCGAGGWDGEPEGVYVHAGAKVRLICVSDATETLIAGAKYDKVLEPFEVRTSRLDLVQYGSDDTKTHRKIKHILGGLSQRSLKKYCKPTHAEQLHTIPGIMDMVARFK